jgi:selenocysteine lyase/cysteine desulfurase
VPAVYTALAGIRLLNGVDQVQGWEQVQELRSHFCDQLTEAGLDIAQPADPTRRGPQVAVRFEDPVAVAERLAGHRIVTAPRNDLLRMSLQYYSTLAGIDRTVDVLCRIN